MCDLITMFRQWDTLTKSLGTTEKVRDDWWNIIVRRYSEEWRFYHTLTHIEQLLQLYDQWKERIAELENVLLAIFFHDIVYDPMALDNEMRSIEVFKKFALDANLTQNVMARISNMIEATISHSAENRQTDLDLCLFLDFDLAILGQDVDVYKQYTENIRREYIHYDDAAYRDGRIKVLTSLLNSSSLYATEELQEEYEKQARRNILEEIASLQSQN